MTTTKAWSPSATLSSTPVTVTVWGDAQFSAVKVKVAGLTVPSPSSELERAMVTSASGSVFKTTVKVSVAPDSLVIKPSMGSTVTPGLSLSVLVTATSSASMPPYSVSSDTAGAVFMV